MKIHRFCLKSFIFGENIKILDQEIIHQMKDVFRFEVKDIVRVFDGVENESEYKIESINKKEVVLEKVRDLKKSEILIQKKKSLAFAILKGEHTEMVLEKCTELGVTDFYPLITDRTVKTGLRTGRCEKIIKEATEQCGFVRLPKLHEPTNFADFLALHNNSQLLVLDMSGEILHKNSKIFSEKNLVGSANNLEKNIVPLIGPEGGWSDDERKMFQEKNIQTFSLGPQTLRAETACIAVSAKLN